MSLEKLGFKNLMKSMMGKPSVGTYVYRGKDYFYDQIIISNALDNNNLTVIKDSISILDLPKYRQQEGK